VLSAVHPKKEKRISNPGLEEKSEDEGVSFLSLK
jgi:hypothetical protein